MCATPTLRAQTDSSLRACSDRCSGGFRLAYLASRPGKRLSFVQREAADKLRRCPRTRSAAAAEPGVAVVRVVVLDAHPVRIGVRRRQRVYLQDLARIGIDLVQDTASGRQHPQLSAIPFDVGPGRRFLRPERLRCDRCRTGRRRDPPETALWGNSSSLVTQRLPMCPLRRVDAG